MLERIKQLFAPRVIYKIVEVKAPRPSFRWDKHTQDAVSTLVAHPGFVALIERLGITKAQLETKNNTQWKKDLREADFLQAGIFWCNWLKEQVDKATFKGSQPTYVDPLAEEQAAFEILDAQIERVGMDNGNPRVS